MQTYNRSARKANHPLSEARRYPRQTLRSLNRAQHEADGRRRKVLHKLIVAQSLIRKSLLHLAGGGQ